MLRETTERVGRPGVAGVAAVGQLVRQPGAWLCHRRAPGVVISSRVRLARNVRDYTFPGWAGEEERGRLWARLGEALAGLDSIPDAIRLDLGALNAVDKEILTERHLISHEMAEKGAGCGLVLSADESIAVMVNEEDHLRLQAMTPGMDLAAIWRRVDAVDSELESRAEYVFSQRLGYITACPSNLGTGLRASVMMHLPGLRLMDEIEAVINGLEKIGFAVRGLLGEGTEANGNFFQISNQASLGVAEEGIVAGLARIVAEVERHELNARGRLLDGRRRLLLDQIGRALGILLHARVLSSSEAVELLSAMRLGVELGLIEGVAVGRLNELLLRTQPGHLQRLSGGAIQTEDRDELRARTVSAKLAAARLTA